LDLEVVDLSELIASHAINGQENPLFPKGWQNRDRGKKPSLDAAMNRASKLDSDQLLEDFLATDRGAPIIEDRNIVVSGNGRWMSMDMARRFFPERWKAYRDSLIERFPEAAGLENPVLVRRLVGKFDPEAIGDLAERSNQSVVARLTTYDQAATDAGAIPDDFGNRLQMRGKTLADALNSPANKDLLQSIIGKMPDTEVEGMFDENGKVSEIGRERISRAMLVRIFGEEAKPFLARNFDEGEFRQIVGGLEQASGELSALAKPANHILDQLKAKIVSGIGFADSALKWSQKDSKRRPSHWFDQGALEARDPEGMRIGKMLVEARSKETIADNLGRLVRGAEDIDGGMFGDEMAINSLIEIVDSVIPKPERAAPKLTQEQIEKVIDDDKAAQVEAAKTPADKAMAKAEEAFAAGDMDGLKAAMEEKRAAEAEPTPWAEGSHSAVVHTEGKPSEISYQNRDFGKSKGQLDGEIVATDQNGIVRGILEYLVDDDGQPFVKFVEVSKDFRRQGIATRMYDKLSKEFPGKELKTFGNIVTPEGQAFRKQYDLRKSVSDEVQVLGKKIGIKSHPDYEAAKTGDPEAAKRLVDDLISDENVAAIREAIGNKKPIIVSVHGSKNRIPMALAQRLGTDLDLPVDTEIVSASGKRTGQDAAFRMVNRATFDGPVQKGADYLLVDDFLTMGGTLADLGRHIEKGGGNVLLNATLAAARGSKKLRATEKQVGFLKSKYPDLETAYKENYGHGLEGLTVSEASQLISNPELAKRIIDGGTTEGRQAPSGEETPRAVPEERPKVDSRAANQANKLRAVANKTLDDATERMGRDRKDNTARRARMAAHAFEQAAKDEALAKTMLNIADAIESGEALHLKNVSTKSQVETLQQLARQAHYERVRQEVKTNREEAYQEPLSADDLRYVEYPVPYVHPANLRDFLTDLQGKRGTKALISKAQNSSAIGSGKFYSTDLLDELIAAGKKHGVNTEPLTRNYDTLKRVRAMGLTDAQSLTGAIREYITLAARQAGEDPIKRAERELKGYKIPGFFPTPKKIVDQMIDIADIQPGDKVLEPSAGKGDIAEAIMARGVTPDAYEISHNLREILKMKGIEAKPDFMEGDAAASYDKIVMNPPFENGMDMTHVQRAYQMLNPGGRVVAIMSEGPFFRSDAKSLAFRDWLDSLDAVIEPMEEGSFAGDDAFRQTGVRTRMVMIDKPGGESVAERRKKFNPDEGGDLFGDPEELELQAPEAAAPTVKKPAKPDIEKKDSGQDSFLGIGDKNGQDRLFENRNLELDDYEAQHIAQREARERIFEEFNPKIEYDPVRELNQIVDSLDSQVTYWREQMNAAKEGTPEYQKARFELSEATDRLFEADQALHKATGGKGMLYGFEPLPGTRDVLGEMKKPTIEDFFGNGPIELNSGLNVPQILGYSHVQRGPKANVSNYLAFQRFTTRNLTQLEAINPKAAEAARRAASSAAETSVLMRRAIPEIAKAAGGPDAWLKLRTMIVESRLRGLRQRWAQMAEAVNVIGTGQNPAIFGQPALSGDIATPLTEMKAAWNSGLRGIAERLVVPDQKSLFFDPGFDGLAGEPLAYVVDGMLDRGDWANARELVYRAFKQAQADVGMVMDPDEFTALAKDPNMNEGLRVYKESFEKPIAQNHAQNEGIFSTALGPLETYFPLIPMDENGGLLRGGRDRFRRWKKPANSRNNFATGLASKYDLSVEGLEESLRSAIKTNNIAALIQTLTDNRLIQPLSPEARAKLGRDPVIRIGEDDFSARVVELQPPKQVTKEGKTYMEGGMVALVPDWMAKELAPVLERNEWTRMDEGRIIDKINAFGMAGPLDAVFHTQNVLGSMVSGTPFVGRGILGKTIGNLPVTKLLTTIAEIIRTDPNTPESLAELMDMARNGELPSKYGQVTYSKKFAEETGAKRQLLTFGPLLYGPSGIDVRARLLMRRIAREINPDATPEEIFKFSAQLGIYNRALSGAIERSVKDVGMSPFFTAGKTMYVNGIKSWLGITPLPDQNMTMAQKIQYRLAQQLSGGAVGTVATWAIAYKVYTGVWPWEDSRARLLQIPLNDEDRKSKWAKTLYGDNERVGYVGFGFFNPSVERGGRALGIAGAFNTNMRGGTRGQMLERALLDATNSLLHPFTSGPTFQAGFTAATGSEPYIQSTRDLTGNFKPQLKQAVPTYEPGRQIIENLKRGMVSTNAFFADTAEKMGMIEPVYPHKGDEGLWYARGIVDIITPRFYKGSGDPVRESERLEKEMERFENEALWKKFGEDVTWVRDRLKTLGSKKRPFDTFLTKFKEAETPHDMERAERYMRQRATKIRKNLEAAEKRSGSRRLSKADIEKALP
jgi:hypoxanthine-guanine phosphoribosyltransferase/ribosomal protein S18 acetylase RimI-like enzyme